MDDFVNKQGLKIEFSPVFSPRSKRINESNHYSADMIVRKIMDEDAKKVLQDTFNITSWIHNEILW